MCFSVPLSFRPSQYVRTSQLFDDPQPTSVFRSESYDLSWYNLWLFKELISTPHEIQRLRVGTDDLRQGNAFERVFAAIAKFVRVHEGVSIDDIVEHLRDTLQMDVTYESNKAQRSLVFAILGWQSMLYRAAFNNCSMDEFAIHKEDDQSNFGGMAFTKNKVPATSADQPLFAFLRGFGNLLPRAPPLTSQLPSDYAKAAAIWLPLNPAETNMYFLRSLLQVRVRWVDTLAQHLDYNRSSRTLSLFSYPSFCAAMLQSKGTLHAFVAAAAAAAAAAECTEETKPFDKNHNHNHNPFDHRRSNEEDIAQLLREVILSFRLLFGQHGRSRKSFPHVYRLTDRAQVPDQLLASLCMTKHMHHLPRSLSLPFVPDQPIYFAAQHFPTFASRIEVIARELKDCRPSSLGGLLRDRRDTLQYWTFWLVAIFGGLSIFLSLVQVLLQAVQLSLG